MTSIENPLTGSPPAEVPLPNAPLVRVIAQVRFPLVTAVGNRDFLAPFQEAIRSEYPILRSEQSRSVVFGQEGAMDTRSSTLWRFHDKNSEWRVTLTPEFLALETSHYSSRADFLDRLRRVLGALESHVNPQLIDRLGVRYIDRIAGAALENLPALLRPEVCGIQSTPLALHALHSLSEVLLEIPEEDARLMARWGLVPAGATVDPGGVEPVHEPSWLLDLDGFLAKPQELDVDSIVQQAERFAERIYSVFRWVVTDEFLKHYGGQK